MAVVGVGNEINIVENALRDLVERVLSSIHGESWFGHLGVSEERVEAWKARRAEEPKRRPGGEVEQRLLYYAEFYDVVEIIGKNWDTAFHRCFGNKKRFEVYADRLAAFRNPDAHSRALLPFEEHLVLGMSGELRQEIAVFLSSGAGGPEPEYFPRIEEIRDSYGNRGVGQATVGWVSSLTRSAIVLRPGDRVSFVGTAWDPENVAIEWTVSLVSRSGLTKVSGVTLEWEWLVEESDISESTVVEFKLTSARPYHRYSGHDDSLSIAYKVLPRRP